MSPVFPEPTRRLREWYDRWFVNHFKHLQAYYTLEEVSRIKKLGEGMTVSALFEFRVEDQMMFDKLDYGTTTTPTFNLRTLVDNFLMSIYPEYEDDVGIMSLVGLV